MSEKLQKVLARLGIGSRRQMESWIQAGRVAVDGKLAKLGDRVEANANIKVDGKPLKLNQLSAAATMPTRVLLYNKPIGEVCTRSDEKGRATVFTRLPELKVGRWISIGRLDLNSAGLLLFTNDGELAHGLMHPSRELEREYLVRIFGEVNNEILQELRQGVELDEGLARFKSIKQLRGDGVNQWVKVVVTEGRNRLVRRLWNAREIVVNRLIRVRFCDIVLPNSLSPGGFIELGQKDVDALLHMAQKPKPKASS
ncbi:MAG: pseudouridine synthase [Gammaproteobacteria bacterium]|nr:pseudouridine synthase [Gammaproteobacteria bacterium]